MLQKGAHKVILSGNIKKINKCTPVPKSSNNEPISPAFISHQIAVRVIK